jgi:hypothetical protein
VIHKIFFRAKLSETAPENGENRIYANTRIVSAEAKIADARLGFNSYEIKASPNQVKASPTRLASCDVKSLAKVLFLNILKGSTINFVIICFIVFSFYFYISAISEVI